MVKISGKLTDDEIFEKIAEYKKKCPKEKEEDEMQN